jgi:hypothetical protein
MVNLVDCCVNANVAALFAHVNARHVPGYHEAVLTVRAGVEWADDRSAKWSSLTPFYPSTRSLVEAVEHAVACGARELEDVLERLRALPPELVDAGDGVCRSAYGRTIWHSTAIECSRRAGRSCEAAAAG